MEAFICWINTNITLDTVKGVLASAPGVILAGFSLYFAYQKI